MRKVYNLASAIFFDNTNYYDDGLGGRLDIIPNVAMIIYATDRKCSLDDASASVVSKLYGLLYSDIENVGYSEYTITGYSCNSFKIGGHDLEKEISAYVGKYIHLVLEVKECKN